MVAASRSNEFNATPDALIATRCDETPQPRLATFRGFDSRTGFRQDFWIKRLRSFLYPNVPRGDVGKALGLALAGALIAGGFGVLHDEVTYTISPEYFTRMKFQQFAAWDLGWPRRVFVAEIGFLASWWVGLIAGWFLARLALPKFFEPGKSVMRAMAIIVGCALVLATIAGFAGPTLYGQRDGWKEALVEMGVTDDRRFQQVAGIHLGSYVGAFVGWLAMMVRFVWAKREV